MVARDEVSGDVVSVAQWSVPLPLDGFQGNRGREGEDVERENTGKVEETVQEKEEREEREAFDEEGYLNSLPPTCNHALIFEFTTRLRVLRERILQGAPHFLLENLATHPRHREQGLATRLMRNALDMADKRSLVVYLETGEENKARGLYERLGFKEKGTERIALKRFASREERERLEVGDVHVVIGYVRLPSKTT